MSWLLEVLPGGPPAMPSYLNVFTNSCGEPLNQSSGVFFDSARDWIGPASVRLVLQTPPIEFEHQSLRTQTCELSIFHAAYLSPRPAARIQQVVRRATARIEA